MEINRALLEQKLTELETLREHQEQTVQQQAHNLSAIIGTIQFVQTLLQDGSEVHIEIKRPEEQA